MTSVGQRGAKVTVHSPSANSAAMGNDGGEGRKRGKQDGGAKSKKARYLTNPVSTAAFPSSSVGVLVTVDPYFEFKAVKEALLLIEEHFDKLKGPDDAAAAAGSSSAGSKDISALLAEEVADLKDNSKQRFRKHDTGVKGCFFVVFPTAGGPSPIDVVLSILKEAQSTRTLRTRNCMRFMPITHTCHCSLEEIQELAPKVVEGHFPEGEGAECIPFSVEYEHRASDKLDRMEVINAFAQRVKCPPHKVNLKAPVKTILVQLVRNSCGCAVVPEYHELARYNIRSLSGFIDKGQQAKDQRKDKDAAKPDDSANKEEEKKQEESNEEGKQEAKAE